MNNGTGVILAPISASANLARILVGSAPCLCNIDYSGSSPVVTSTSLTSVNGTGPSVTQPFDSTRPPGLLVGTYTTSVSNLTNIRTPVVKGNSLNWRSVKCGGDIAGLSGAYLGPNVAIGQNKGWVYGNYTDVGIIYLTEGVT